MGLKQKKKHIVSCFTVQNDPSHDFAQRSTTDERRQMFGRSLNSDRIPAGQMEPELQKAISQIKPNERDDVARAFFKHFKERGLSDRNLEQQLGLSTHCR
jgi:predicted outer membrane protein